MKKRAFGLGVIGLLLAAALFGAFNQSGEDLFQKALRLERNEGKLTEAIEIYNKVVAEKGNEGLSAQAQLRIGLCYEKLGQKSVTLAQDAFQKVIDNYPSQSEEVRIAKEKLSLLLKKQSVPEKKESDFSLEKVWDDTTDSFFMGSPSPDGRFVTFVDWQNFANLGIRDLLKGESHFLTHLDSWGAGESAYQSIFSPDGGIIAFTWQNKEGEGELRIIGIDGENLRTLSKDAGWPEPKSWTKDGSRILVFLRQKETMDIAFVSVKDGSIEKLISFPSEKSASKMSLSPDEKFIVICLKQQDVSSSSDLYSMSSEGNNVTSLISHPANDELLGWTPDGKFVLFTSDRTGSLDLWGIQVKDGKPDGDPQLIRHAVGDFRPLGLTPEGALYFGQNSGWSDIFVAELDPETGKILSPPVKAIQKYERYNSAPDWSPDGSSLICRSSRGKSLSGGDVAILMRSFQNDEIQELIPKNVSGLNFHFIRWSPDGRAILGVGSDEKKNYGALWAIDAQTGESKIIARPDGDSTIFQPEWAPDGQSIFFLRRTMQDRRIILFKIATGEEQQLLSTSLSVYNLTLSPDGEQLAFYGDDTLMLLSTRGGEPQKLLQENNVNSIAWSQDGRFLLYGKRRNAKSNMVDVWRVSVRGGEPERLELSMLNLMHLRIHPDGRKIAFTAAEQPSKSEVWVMKNFLPKTNNKK